ncbi:MAG: hypothetical protein H5T86_04865 [Armatimonadetes bacterium]|nr:hypothetical protein [Armatimonadota bacterium]
MDIGKLKEYANDIRPLVEGNPPWRVDPAIHRLFERQEWELISVLLLSVAEATARQIIQRLLELRLYGPLVVAACLRRHIRTQPFVFRSGQGAARRVFRDIDAEGVGTEGIPEHILEEMREMAELAERTREAQILRSEAMDRGPMREFIINRLAERIGTDNEALEALVVIARAAAWEETRRAAAMKIANHAPSVQKLAAALRTDDLIALANSSQLEAVARNMARVMAEHLDALREKNDTAALEFIARHHADDEVRRAVWQSLGHTEELPPLPEL